MSAVIVGLIAFGLILASIAVGLTMRHWVPEAHISGDSKEVIRLATALIGTMAAVVLALLFASTRTSFEATNASVGRMTTSVIELDHMLREYGPDGEALRKALRQDVVAIVASIWQDDVTVQQRADANAPGAQVRVLTMLRQMTPANPLQASAPTPTVAASQAPVTAPPTTPPAVAPDKAFQLKLCLGSSKLPAAYEPAPITPPATPPISAPSNM